ncbi:type 2 lanthipeptide synthetase LanM family protein [Nostoc sp. FACHB-888]|uniref:type 2 lanthipeptide synthetase LanM family protein n=1 Tax=Nostoc sp. FACHB-888 TaxID=2692842 RepID=UPI00168594D1|nr:type 2 lanthipeptide synthetase LanM family protein [Nostoc sp. FACHB-888]MBD2243784.1 type 2 lantipeptide synthetase LanM [Nostoc sp. FACHB-888]
MVSEIVPTSDISIDFYQERLVFKDKFSTQDLIKIVEKASTIPERLSAGFVANESEADEHLINSRSQKWCQVVAKGNQQKFEKRLDWDGLDISTVRRALGSVSLADQRYLPSWVETLREAMQAADWDSNQNDLEQRQYLNPQKPLPFEEVLLPFVDVASKRLVERAGSSYQLLSKAAHTQLERSLLKQLTGLCVSPLDLEFSIFRSFNDSPLIRAIAQLQDNFSRQQYTKFVKNLLNDGLLSFFQEYSVLARLVATAMDFWVDAVAEFLLRLASDWGKIQLTFQGEELGQVVAVDSALSDPHNCGRSVIIVKFASDLKLVYKPKNLGLEQAYFELLAWVNQQGVSLLFKLLKVINCSSHGWMEFVDAIPCQDQQAVKRYYQRAGMMLCIVYALRGTDCHCENLIACGEQPVLVDLETLLHHRTWANKDDAEAQALANERLQDSVAGTALLPGWQLIPYGQTEGLRLDLSGLGGFGEQEMPYRALKWKHINTDGMAIAHEYTKMLPQQNRPFGEGVDASLNNHHKELIDGFHQMYQFLMEHQEALLAADSPIAAFAHQKVRLVLRNTSVYFSVLQKSLNHKCLRDGVEHSIELDILSRAFLTSKDKHPFWALLAAEKQALEQLDIPFFTAYSDSDAIAINPEQTIDKFLNRPSYDDVISRLQQLNDGDLAQQISIIQGSLYSCLSNEHLHSLPLQSTELCEYTVTPLSQAAMLQQAIAIAQEVQQRAIRGNNGTVAWIGMGYISETQKFQLQPLGYSLYDGCSGISLFLAALASVTGRAEFGDLALASLQSLRKTLYGSDGDSQQKLTEQMGIGGVKGLASIVYTFVRIGEFLGEAELIQDAQKIASWMTLNETAVHQSFGIMNGGAGTILSLLALYKATQERATLMQATAWGKHLLDNCITTDGNYKTCTNSDQKLVTGFFDGAAGIAYALLQLYIATKNLVFLSAAEEAIAYEQKVFSVKGNCPDFKSTCMDNGTLSSMTGWCNGASGIAIACLEHLAVLAQDEILQETEIALQITAQLDLQALDNLYCGNFGHIELLLIAARQLSRPELLEIAQKQAASVVTRANQSGCFQLLPNLPDEVYNPGFFLGKAGIGYELLRLVHPHLLPSVLLWQ